MHNHNSTSLFKAQSQMKDAITSNVCWIADIEVFRAIKDELVIAYNYQMRLPLPLPGTNSSSWSSSKKEWKGSKKEG